MEEHSEDMERMSAASKYTHKIAYMISAYTLPDSLINLINALNCHDVDFYIHIDKKVDDYVFKKNLEDYLNVNFLPDKMRVKITWGGYSQVQMQYNMIKTVMNSGYKYVRIVNLTGTDYPTMPNETIIKTFLDSSKEFIIGFRFRGQENVDKGSPKNMKNKVLYMYFNDCSSRLIRLLGGKIKRYRNYDNIGYDFYFGSEYWGLTSDILEELIEDYENDTKLSKCLRYAFAPSEIWIHTLFFNSIFKSKGIVYGNIYEGLSELSPLEYFEYGNCVKVLTKDDFEKIMQSGKMFIRKVDLEKSRELITLINNHRQEMTIKMADSAFDS